MRCADYCDGRYDSFSSKRILLLVPEKSAQDCFDRIHANFSLTSLPSKSIEDVVFDLVQHCPSSHYNSPFWTTNSGALVWNNNSSLTVGIRGNGRFSNIASVEHFITLVDLLLLYQHLQLTCFENQKGKGNSRFFVYYRFSDEVHNDEMNTIGAACGASGVLYTLIATVIGRRAATAAFISGVNPAPCARNTESSRPVAST
ncbi:hypothetical protein ZIOFF_050908 [Zingiber officinale]|uniref:Uncharacterized protein n=1 Tax=Zingiber officinale TaxID=94328 RepID=A0A8J5KRM6_ZINOF|nr:hypothetical protein ZIOFF_050908 [Zingiber officinale]